MHKAFVLQQSPYILTFTPLFTDGNILASISAAQELKKEQDFIVIFNRNIEFEMNGCSIYISKYVCMGIAGAYILNMLN